MLLGYARSSEEEEEEEEGLSMGEGRESGKPTRVPLASRKHDPRPDARMLGIVLLLSTTYYVHTIVLCRE